MDLAALFQLALGAGLIAACVIASLAYGNRKALREANADLRDRVTDLEKDRTEHRAQIAELQSRNEVLTSMVTGEVHWKALAEAQDQLVRDAHRHWVEEQEALERLHTLTERVWNKLEATA